MTNINEDKKTAWAALGYTGTYNDMEAAFYIDNPKGTNQEYFDFLRGEGYTGTLNDMEKQYYVNGTPGGASDEFFSDVMFLSGFEGTDGSTTVIDESSVGRTLTAQASAQIDTDQFKFGSSSLFVNDSADRVTAASAADLQIGSSDFTLEGFFRYSLTPLAFKLLIGKYQNSGNQKSYGIFEFAGDLLFYMSSTGGNTILKLSTAFVPVIGTWYHLAVDFDGTTYRMYIDGVLGDTTTTKTTAFASTSAFVIGAQSDGIDEFVGHVDEARLTIGTARYAGAFTPPDAAFPRA